MKKTLAIILALVLCLSMLSACGSAEPAATEAPEAPEASAEAAAPAEAEAVEISMGWWGAESRHAYTQDLANKYAEANPNVSFTFQPNAWDGYWEKITTQAAGGNLPNIMQMDYAFINNYVVNETLMDLTPFVEDGTINVENVDEKLLETCTFDGKLYGVPLTQSARAICINTASLKNAGLEVPSNDWTWEDFVELCLAYTEKTGNRAFEGYLNSWDLVNAMLMQQGYELYAADNSKLGIETSEPLVPYFELFHKLMEEGACVTPDENVTASQLPADQGLISTEKALLTFNSNAFPGWTMNNDLITRVIPAMKDGKNGNWAKPGMYFCISATTDEATAREAAKMLNWWLNSEEVAEVQGTDRGVPASSAARDYLQSKSDLTPIQKDTFDYFNALPQYSTECPPPAATGEAEISAEWKVIMDNMLNGVLTPAEAAEELFNTANEILARNAG